MPRRIIPAALNQPSADGAEGLSITVRSLIAEAQALSTRLAALNEVTVAMQRSTDLEQLLLVMADQARWVIDFQRCTVTSLERGTLHQRVLRSASQASAPSDEPLYHRPAIERVLQQGYALVQHSIPPDDNPPPEARSALLLPIFDREQAIGTLNFYSAAGKPYSQHDLRIATALAMQVSAILQNARLILAVTHARDELHTVLESIGDGVVVLDLNGNVLLANRALRTIAPELPENMVGQPLPGLLSDATDSKQVFAHTTVQPAQQSLSTVAVGENTNGIAELSNGRHIAWASTPLRKAGKVEGLVLTVRDVTAQVELEQLREDMLRMLVHDFRTPLTSIIMGVDLLDYYHADGEAEGHAIMTGVVRNSAHRLLGQVNLLLDVSKLEAGRLELERSLVDLDEIAASALAAVGPLAKSAEQQLELRVASELPQISGDRELLRRVLDNLLGNACKFTPQGGQIAIGAQLDAASAEVELWVSDTGPGIPEQDREQIFEKYGQLRSARQRSGTGLGLAFCRMVAEAHGGRIGVRPGPAKGSIFWLRLPLTAPA
jgi:PAS domain S-box-containing protein